jgi:sodium-dependent dicarboxylate transporter 2/3/5
MAKILLIDDENDFRSSLAERLKVRGYDCIELSSGENAVKTIRAKSEIDVVLLDRKMPGMQGEEVLKEIKQYRPELHVIILTGHGSAESAVEVGKLDAFGYLEKPVEIETLIAKIEEARESTPIVLEALEIQSESKTFWSWLKGSNNSKPGIIILGILMFAAIAFMPTPNRLYELLSAPKTGEMSDINMGYSDYNKMEKDQTITKYYSEKYKVGNKKINPNGKSIYEDLTLGEAAQRAKVMIALLCIAALFWASGAIPIGVTALLVGVVMYFFGIMQPNDVASSYVKDSVIFVFGVLAFSKAITKTGLDKRIGLLLLGSSKSIPMFLFVFLPLFGMVCSFLSEHALIAFIMPVLLIVYLNSIKTFGLKEDVSFGVMLFLAVNFTANSGGPGSPAAGGRNAIMMGILSDYGVNISFGEWVVYGLPFVPVMGLIIGVYFYFACYRKSKVKKANIAEIVKQAASKIGPMNRDEYITAAVLILLVSLWVGASDILGMGGPVILALVLLNFFRILGWRDIKKVQWEVVALYAAATAMGKGLAVSGAALFIADGFVSILPEFLKSGDGLIVSASLITGVATNFMSDGAAVSAIGPITVPMATIANSTIAETSPVLVGLATAFASSFAHIFVIGTPNNAIVYAMAQNPKTGKRLVSLKDFAIHGLIIWLLSMLVLCFWMILTYWKII